MENSVDKSVLFEYFSGKSTPLRKKLIDEWLQTTGNVELYYEWLDEWEKTNSLFFPDEETAFERIVGSGDTTLPLMEGRNPVMTRRIGLPRVFPFRNIAAAVAVLILLAGVWSVKNVLLYRSMTTAYGETRTVILPDGSLVSMNANSTIRYNRFGFGNDRREVFLTGEADFAVTHSTNSQPFVVTTDQDLKVLVLGTRFTVYARGQNRRVVLREGKVQLNFTEEQKEKNVVMQPGDLFTAGSNGSHQVKNISNPESLSAWKDHEFLFDGTALSEMAGMIRDNFGLSVQFESPALAGHTITGSFHADTADELLDVIAQLLNIHYQIREDTIYFFE